MEFRNKNKPLDAGMEIHHQEVVKVVAPLTCDACKNRRLAGPPVPVLLSQSFHVSTWILHISASVSASLLGNFPVSVQLIRCILRVGHQLRLTGTVLPHILGSLTNRLNRNIHLPHAIFQHLVQYVIQRLWYVRECRIQVTVNFNLRGVSIFYLAHISEINMHQLQCDLTESDFYK